MNVVMVIVAYGNKIIARVNCIVGQDTMKSLAAVCTNGGLCLVGRQAAVYGEAAPASTEGT